MSKSRRKRKGSGNRPAKKRSKKEQAVSWTWKDRLVVSGVVLGLMILPAVGVKLFSISQAYQRAVEKRVHRWEVKYDLDQSQVEQLIAVETEFHHYQKPFSFQKEPTKTDEEAHRSELAEILKQQIEVPDH